MVWSHKDMFSIIVLINEIDQTEVILKAEDMTLCIKVMGIIVSSDFLFICHDKVTIYIGILFETFTIVN